MSTIDEFMRVQDELYRRFPHSFEPDCTRADSYDRIMNTLCVLILGGVTTLDEVALTYDELEQAGINEVVRNGKREVICCTCGKHYFEREQTHSNQLVEYNQTRLQRITGRLQRVYIME